MVRVTTYLERPFYNMGLLYHVVECANEAKCLATLIVSRDEVAKCVATLIENRDNYVKCLASFIMGRGNQIECLTSLIVALTIHWMR
jgi:hypothetical protein